MAVAINTHKYKEAINVQRYAEKVGEVKILWGFITWPKLIYHEQLNHTGLCKTCGTQQYAAIHGIVKLNKYA